MYLSEVNPLICIPNHKLWAGFNNVYFKLEGNNGCGSQKYRVSNILVNKALQFNQGITVGSCGNLGLAIALESTYNNLPYRIFVPKNFHNKIIKQLCALGVRYINFIDGTYEDAVYASHEFSYIENYFDGNPLEETKHLYYEAYEKIALEIINNVPNSIGSVWLVGGNGTTLVGIAKGFTKKDKKPLLGVVSSLNNSALTSSLKKNILVQLHPNSIKETEVNEPLINWNAFSASDALEVFNDFGGFVIELDDQMFLDGQRILIEQFNIFCQPASAGALIGFLSYKNQLDPKDSHIIILTS